MRSPYARYRNPHRGRVSSVASRVVSRLSPRRLASSAKHKKNLDPRTRRATTRPRAPARPRARVVVVATVVVVAVIVVVVVAIVERSVARARF